MMMRVGRGNAVEREREEENKKVVVARSTGPVVANIGNHFFHA